MTIREFYTLVGGSYDDMSERFPSDALILRFLTMLPQDGSMELLARSMDAADALFEAVQREYDKVTGALAQLTA